jgi:hypothetical protein
MPPLPQHEPDDSFLRNEVVLRMSGEKFSAWSREQLRESVLLVGSASHGAVRGTDTRRGRG